MKSLLIAIALLVNLCGAESLCSKEIYDSYLSVYSMKCEGDCEEYKKWVVKMDG